MNSEKILATTKDGLEKTGKVLIKYSPQILTGVGIVGMGLSVVLGIKSTTKAVKIIEEKRREENTYDIPKKEIVKATWKIYLPCVISFVSGAACTINGTRINMRRNAALVTMCAMSEAALQEYKSKTLSMIGAKKEEEIRSSIVQDRMDSNPPESNTLVITGNGDSLCYDIMSGQYFMSDIEKIRKVVNDINEEMLNHGCVSMNELYYELGLEQTKLGNEMGWHISSGLLDLNITGQVMDGKPVIAIDFNRLPSYDYESWG